ncbi:carbohydrate ABC transporter permease [Cohnella silvisoli]|uniref:Carbohydrate ABC transporter permease n=1 Tax=Cohnella silvisoli TaxID=2873699 RepID=A0ABV1L0G6_9BACL|nr:carbohydrate ABC transporter permease [Cohnella silvisoli]MCD9025138.1 carbohydrate ABC transporter permease [Cohnella silvisoli]
MTTRRIVSCLKYGVLGTAAGLVLVPFWLLTVSSFRNTTSLLSYPPKLWPNDGSLSNYMTLFESKQYHFLNWLLNSVIVSGTSTALVLVTSALAGYAFAKRSFIGQKVLFVLVLSTLMVPGIVTLLPAYLIVDWLGWTNTYTGLIVPAIPSAFGVFLLTQFIRTIPKEIEESARLDGCGEYKTFWKIIFPMTTSALAVLAIFNFLGNWGELLWPLITVSEEKMKTLTLGIAGMKTRHAQTSGEMMAATFLSFIPLFILFLFAREKFIEGVTVGAVKE